MTDMNSLPTVTVIVPCRNEARFIGPCLDSILAGDYPPDRLEIVVADGMSDDGTRDILQRYSHEHRQAPTIRVIDNPQRIVSPGLNRAILDARGEIIVRMDAHTEYATDYIRQCVRVLRETGAQNVGGAHRTKAAGYLQTAISLAFHSPFAVGGARSHDIDFEGEVDTVIYGCWRKETLIEIGLFDEELVRNQDDELNLRIHRAGGKIYQSASILSWYRPRASLKALFRQYLQYGYWKVRVIRKHRLPASWRHLVPAAWVLSLAGLAILAPFSAIARSLLVLQLLLYGVASLAAAFHAARRAGILKYLPLLPLIFLIYHLGYGAGFLRGILDFLILQRRPTAHYTRISR